LHDSSLIRHGKIGSIMTRRHGPTHAIRWHAGHRRPNRLLSLIGAREAVRFASSPHPRSFFLATTRASSRNIYRTDTV
jgi:hypothetical protein